MDPLVYCASRIARGPNRAPGRWLTASSKGAPTIATSDVPAPELVRIGDPRQLHERRRPDVRRQVEVVVCLEVGVPAVEGREVRAGRSGRRALSHGDPPGDGRDAVRRGSMGAVSLGAPPVRDRRPAGRAAPMVAPAPRPRRTLGRGTPARRPRRAPDRRTGRRRSGRPASPRGASSRRPAGVAAASRNRIEWPGVPSGAIDRSGWMVGQTQLTLPMSVLPAFGSSPISSMP